MTIPVEVQVLPHGADLPLPAYATPGAAGMDLLAAVAEPVTLAPGDRALIPTGLAIALPPGYELQIRPRSGLALRHGILVAQQPGHDRRGLPRRTPGHPPEHRHGTLHRGARDANRPGRARPGGARALARGCHTRRHHAR